MNDEVVCPACFHDMCEDCIGAGCYCDHEHLYDEDFYDANEDDTMKDGYA